jgi:hypothetical protein
MLTAHSTLSARDVNDYAHGMLHRHLHLEDHGPKCTASVLYAVLLYAASLASTIAQACRSLRKVPSDQSIYDALDATLPDRIELQRRLNLALRDSVPRSVRKGKRPAKLAIDLDLLPYYGKADPDDDMVYKGQEKAGTHYHHGYATVYLVRKGRRFTLGVLAVRHDTPWDVIVKTLLTLARKVIPRIELVLLDRGFYSVAVIRYLQRARYPFIMPVIARGRKRDDPRGPGGTNAFFCWRKSGWGRYELSERRGEGKAHFDVAVKVRRKVRKRPGSKRKNSRVLVYACWGVKGHGVKWVDETYQRRRINWVRQTYRKRYGIETSYRQTNQARAWTTSTKPVRRLLLVGLALLLRNLWAMLHLVVLAQRQRGGPRLRPLLLTLQSMLQWLSQALRLIYGFRDHIVLQHEFIL